MANPESWGDGLDTWLSCGPSSFGLYDHVCSPFLQPTRYSPYAGWGESTNIELPLYPTPLQGDVLPDLTGCWQALWGDGLSSLLMFDDFYYEEVFYLDDWEIETVWGNYWLDSGRLIQTINPETPKSSNGEPIVLPPYVQAHIQFENPQTMTLTSTACIAPTCVTRYQKMAIQTPCDSNFGPSSTTFWDYY